jgi:hypothetical protein
MYLRARLVLIRNLFSSLLLSSLELRDTQVYEPQIRALLGTALHFCEVDLKLRTVPIESQLTIPPVTYGVISGPP